MRMALDADKLAQAYRSIAAWRANPGAPVPCPSCAAASLQIIDRSARPYAEWYALACSSCGLDQTLHIPLGPPVHSLD
jgi:hypothetical protein